MATGTSKAFEKMSIELLFEPDIFVFHSIRHGNFLYDQEGNPVYQDRHPSRYERLVKASYEHAITVSQTNYESYKELSKEEKIEYLEGILIHHYQQVSDPDYNPMPLTREHASLIKAVVEEELKSLKQ